MTPDVRDAIVNAANQAGVDPAYALAVADRESGGDPTAHASRSIFGLFQMSGPLRAQYGIGDSIDPADQAKGWTAFIGDTRKDIAARIGRDPTDQETYLGHYFGAGRAARMISGQIAPSTDVRDVFTPQELQANPNIAKAGTVGQLTSSIESDISQRMARFGGQGNGAQAGPNFAAYGEGDGLSSHSASLGNAAGPRAQPLDFAAFGAATSPVQGEIPAPALEQPEALPAEEQPEAPQLGPPTTPAALAEQQMLRQRLGMGAQPVGGISAVPGQQPQTPAPVQSGPIGQPSLPQNAALAQVPGAPPQQQGQPNGQA